jgi:hypothetical protein
MKKTSELHKYGKESWSDCGGFFLAVRFCCFAAAHATCSNLARIRGIHCMNLFLMHEPCIMSAGEGATELTLQNVTVSPSPVKAGKNFTLGLELFNGEVFRSKYAYTPMSFNPLFMAQDSLALLLFIIPQ